MSIDQTAPGAVPTNSKTPTAWIAGGVLGVVSLATAAAIALRPATPAPEANAAAALPAATAAATTTANAATPEAAKPEAAAARTATHAAAPRPARAVPAEAQTKVAAAVCASCGVVESVVAVKRKGEGTGLGAVTGGVLGAVIGHQMGNGNGKKAMTVLGAVGGGVAGHEVEKQVRADTVYRVRVRMDDGSERTIEQAQAPATGARVEVQGSTLKALHGAG